MATRKGCAVPDCDRPHRRNGYCGMHSQRLRRNGDPIAVRLRPSRSGMAHPLWAGSRVGYKGVHIRLSKMRGKASQHRCACGAPAPDWASDHSDPNERRSGDGLTYSVDLNRYVALCRSCHRSLDKEV